MARDEAGRQSYDPCTAEHAANKKRERRPAVGRQPMARDVMRLLSRVNVIKIRPTVGREKTIARTTTNTGGEERCFEGSAHSMSVVFLSPWLYNI